MFSLKDAFFAFTLLALLLLVGRWLKHKIGLFQQLYLPSSIIAGVVGLLLGPQILGAIATNLGYEGSYLAENGLFTEPIREVWKQSPGVFINIVFAALFLGETIPSPRDIWRKAAPQVAFGQTLAWGQYVVGILLTLLILTPLFGINPMAGALIEMTFEGGHGTAAGMGDTLRELGFPEGADMALGLATVGIVSGIVAGVFLTNWGRRRDYLAFPNEGTQPEDPDSEIIPEMIPPEDRETRLARARLMRNLLIDPLSLNFGFVALAVVIGWLILQILGQVEALTWGRTGFILVEYIPLFPMALIGGVIVQLFMKSRRLSPLIMRPLQGHIAGLALDVVIVSALASLSLAVLGENLVPFVVLSLGGIIWNIWAFVYLGPRLLPSYWFERGIGDMGQSMGVTATGILLIRMVDPYNRTGAFESFAYKQLFFEPIVGGGLFTAAAPALIVNFGAIPVLILTGGLLIFWIVLGFYLYKKLKPPQKTGYTEVIRR
ncbi:sodium/glutamate symporter [Gloeothece citriformis PCC 7424]|uniref:Sodium/glutamate symporter n=1 Tax=Gloeothece citriformis (strain PCC 7424) TaxID=65393 RepID=B7KAM8_GLOC7|nr:sodium/glutamate symporter [Gloeothece citriformis]ACK68700.1 sodium/glutamate symporter [Gloeothece citriformis PCC 7424]